MKTKNYRNSQIFGTSVSLMNEFPSSQQSDKAQVDCPFTGDTTMDSLMLGDPTDGEIFIGEPAIITQEDYNEMTSGAPLPAVVARKAMKRANAAGNIRKALGISQAATLAVPDSAVKMSQFDPILVENGTVVQFGTTGRVSGNSLVANINKWKSDFPTLMNQKRAVGDSGMSDVTVEFGEVEADALGYVAGKLAVPFLFLAITSTANSVRVGARYNIQVVATSEKGMTLSSDKFTVEWKNTTAPLKLTLIPYLRLKETLLPLLAAFGNPGTEVTLSIIIGGMALGDSVEVTTPGVDSEETARLLKMFNIQ